MRPKMLALILFGALLHLAVCELDKLPYYSQEARLKTQLFHVYEKSVAPLTKSADNVTVSFGLSLQGLESLDFQTETLTTFVYLNEVWSDVRLKWNESAYNGLHRLRVPYADIWTPDIVPYNSVGESNVHSANELVIVDPSGRVSYVSHRRLRTTCSMDMKSFPFDLQLCVIKFGSWIYDGDDLVLATTGTDLSTYTTNPTWDLLEATDNLHSTVYECCPETYYDITFRFKLQRRTGLLKNMYVSPSVCLALVVPAVFLLPTGSSHKFILGCGLLISQVLVLGMLASFLPFTHFTVPKLVTYNMASMTLTLLSLAMSAVITCLWERASRGGSGVPRAIKALFLGLLGRMLCVRRESKVEHQATYSESSKTEQTKSTDTAAEWLQLAVVLDRLLLVVYLVLVLACTILLYTA